MNDPTPGYVLKNANMLVSTNQYESLTAIEISILIITTLKKLQHRN